MCLHVGGFWIWRLDLEKSGNGRLSCCCWPHESNGGGDRVRWCWWAGGGVFWHTNPPLGSPSLECDQSGGGSGGWAEGSCSLPRGWVTLRGATLGQESGFWQPVSICAHERVKCEGAASALTFSEK